MQHRIRQLIDSLPLREKVGQLFILAFAGSEPGWAKTLVTELHIGGFYLTDDNAPDPEQAQALSLELQRLAALRSVDAPLLLGVDQEGAWGILTRWTDTGPGNLALGVADDAGLTSRMYQCLAGQMKALGYNTVLAPCADVNSNPDNPIIGQRSFGADPRKVSRHVALATEAILQSGMLACAKHFPGHGDTATDSHSGLPQVLLSEAALLASHLQPFVAAIEAGVPLIMTSHICYPALDPEFPATLSPRILTGLLRETLGFDGVILTDSMNMGAMRRHFDPVTAAVQALRAGADLVMLSEEHYENAVTDYQAIQRQTIEGVVAAVAGGELPEDRINEALQRVLALRYQLSEPVTAPIPLSRGLGLTAARQACRLLRDEDQVLPLQQPFYLVPLAEPDEYSQICNSRGIGPNDPRPASEALQQALRELGAGFELLSFGRLQQLLGDTAPDWPVVLISEDYPLPGSQLNLGRQRERVQQLLAAGLRPVLLGLRSDDELRFYAGLGTYLCSYSSRRCAAQALAERLTGRQLPAAAEG